MSQMNLLSERMRCLSETTADDFPNATIERWMGEAADALDENVVTIERLRSDLRFITEQASGVRNRAEEVVNLARAAGSLNGQKSGDDE